MPSMMPPVRRADEATWELLRDEWELLLAIGSGPTDLEQVVERVGSPPGDLEFRIGRLSSRGLVEPRGDGWGLVPAVYERQEAMSSYLRDLILDRVELGSGPPALAMGLMTGAGEPEGLENIHALADSSALAECVTMASVPEPDHAERFVAVFAATTLPVRAGGSRTERWVDVLRGAAVQRARGEAEGLARMWVAEMRVAPEVALAIAENLEAYVGGLDGSSFGGAVATAVWAVRACADDGGDA